VPFVCGCRDLGEALRRIGEGAALIRTKGEPGTGNIVEAVRHILDPKGKDAFGPGEISPELAKELPQQVMVSIFRKFAK